MENRPDEPGRVRLMTMHKSKGLQAPVVVLGGMEDFRFNPPTLCLDRSKEPAEGHLRLETKNNWGGTAFAQSLHYDGLLDDEKSANTVERTRLLYVAATRAQNLLVLTRQVGKPPSKSFKTALGAGVPESGRELPAWEEPAAVGVPANPVGEFLLEGVIDLIYQTPQGWKLVDYKTDRIKDSRHLEALTRFHLPQLELYGHLWGKQALGTISEKKLLFLDVARKS